MLESTFRPIIKRLRQQKLCLHCLYIVFLTKNCNNGKKGTFNSLRYVLPFNSIEGG